MFIPLENGRSSFTPGMCESLLEWRSPFLNIDQQVCDLDACLRFLITIIIVFSAHKYFIDFF